MDRSVRRGLLAAATVATTTAAMLLAGVIPASAAPDALSGPEPLRTVTLGANLRFPTGQKVTPPHALQTHELPPADRQADGAQDSGLSANAVSPFGVPVVSATPIAGSAGLNTSFAALNSFDQRSANNGNQFSIEPPDQGLCAGNGFVVEALNDIIRVYRPNGAAASGITDLNSFYGYPPAINRTTFTFGPFVTDPTCLFDAGTQRWFVTVLTIDTDPNTGNFTNKNHLDVAVSRTANPLDGFAIYRLPVQDDGTQHTPHHTSCPCIGDYPHIATDAYGFFVTTNEYPFDPARPGVFGNNFNGAQIYAFDKLALAHRAASVNVVQFSHTQLRQGSTTVPGFTLAPAQVPDSAYDRADNGTEFFLDSIGAMEAQPGGFTGQAASLGVYRLTNTQSLSSAHPSPALAGSLRPSEQYVQPPLATQKFGPTPLANSCSVQDCGLGVGAPGQYSEGGVATNDTRMLQVYLAHGTLYGALDTGVQVNGRLQAGIAWFLVNPGTSPSTSSVAHQGYIAVNSQNVYFPAVAAMADGNGAMAFTLSGSNWYPSAAYALLSPTGVTGSVHVAAAGVGPEDGFSEYAPSTTDPASIPRPRWGDYGAAVPVGSTIWMASEYIAQSCSFATYQHDPTCGNTRVTLTNWSTRISRVTP